MKKHITQTIDLDTSYSDLIESWINGNRNHVISTLASDHPGVAALLIVQGAQDGRLTLSDCNAIANRLIDHRADIAQDDSIPFID